MDKTSRLDKTRTVFEILAIIGAAGWAVWYFWISEEPSLGDRYDIESSIDWYEITDKGCRVEYTVMFHNIGKTNIHLTNATLEVWISRPWEHEKPIQYLDQKWLKENGEKYIDQSIDDLAKFYPPGFDDKVGVNFYVRAAPGKVALFYVDFPDVKSYEYRWDWVCGDHGKMSLSPG